MTTREGDTGKGLPVSIEGEKSPVRQPPENLPKPVPAPEELVVEELDQSEQRLAMYLEARFIRVLRREVTDPYGGLPADDVLARMDDRFPDLHVPERMLRRLEEEQSHRHEHVRRVDALEQYVAETDRENGNEDRELQKSWGRRAERVVLLLVIVGLICLFTGHEAAGITVLGGTLVGVVGSFLAQQIRSKNE